MKKNINPLVLVVLIFAFCFCIYKLTAEEKKPKTSIEIALEKYMNVEVTKDGDTSWLWKGKVLAIDRNNFPAIDITGDGLGDFSTEKPKKAVAAGDSVHGKKYYSCSCGESLYEITP